ncbi:GTPase-GDP dissociation stimulator vimar [Tribolium castaneum]|uniref:Rap1 GTPase-GDP dissociation stimulator 1-B-like Protein n=1 Tax=Tribolium castaneum TaxID=7070 RepID=D6WH32_TRICA|nr:PREDICTED: rap1 GTPase-GDP dissociation stimulator 1-B [Tribolium castaneum]EFA00118.1 Rap1 GTPase-GDP dissociation stimulator 1-B-like Protein [Tribolium castaneum]|eukprot:XP_974912.1 PREDICTED: rap1 GTPase-GDP dissociation stimulator 1-B [Tribolium castaneum]
MSTILTDLTSALEANNEKDIIEKLRRIVAQGEDIELQNNNILKRLITLNNEKITQAFVEVAAELSKQERNRKFFTDKEVIEYLLNLLDKPEESLVIGAIRALGNICYENDDARRIIDKQGLATVISILAKDNNRKNNLLTLKVSGFLVNLLMSNDDLQKAALKFNIVDVIEKLLNKYLKSFNENQMLFAFLLTILNHVIDYIDDQNIPFTESLCCTIIDIFKLSTTPEISVLCLEILHGQSEKEDIKTILAKKGICELVFELVEKYRSQVNDEESRSVMKMACDIIVIILTGDDCMNLLYNNGQGKVYENMVTWLDSDDPDLLSTGVLAIGNFARKDTHCIQMVQKGISKKLIALLAKYNTRESDIKVQHALLSTLKNLVIPQQNKRIVLEEGLIEVIYPMINLEQYLVIFKLLGTFRMVIDGQEKAALDLISRKEFLEKLIYWCYNSDHLGVRGEIPRLLSWLIKHCHSFKPFHALLQVRDSVKCLVEMMSSNHAVMQNESFYALNLLCIGCGVSHENDSSNGVNGDHANEDGVLFEQLIDAEIGKNLSFVVNKYSDKMDKQTIENLVTLLEQLINSRAVSSHLKSNNVGEALAKLASNSNAQSLSDKLNHVMSEINKN